MQNLAPFCQLGPAVNPRAPVLPAGVVWGLATIIGMAMRSAARVASSCGNLCERVAVGLLIAPARP